MSTIDPGLYFAIRRVVDNIHPHTLMEDEMVKKYKNLNKEKVFKDYSKLVCNLNKKDFDRTTGDRIDREQNLIKETSDENDELAFNKEIPLNSDEKTNIKKIINYSNQKNFFDKHGADYEAGLLSAPRTHLTEDELDRIDKMTCEDPDLDWFDDYGKHMFVHHGWNQKDFESHPTKLDRAVAFHIVHNPILGTVLQGGATSFDELKALNLNPPNYQKESSTISRIPVMGVPNIFMVNDHMLIFHNKPGNSEDHIKDHENGVSNHTHPI